MGIFLSPYNFSIQYIRSEKNHTDFLSRAALTNIEKDDNKHDYYSNISYFNYVKENLPLDYKDIKLETQTDPILSKVIFISKMGGQM